jgi:LacI family transcriptional regulator
VLKAIREAGLRCPSDIAVVSYDGTVESEYCCPSLTVSRQPIQAMADAAVAAVLGLGSGSDHDHRFATELVIRESCGCSESAAYDPP